MQPFVTIKNHPRPLSRTRAIKKAVGYLNNDAIHAAIASNVSKTSNFADSLKKHFLIRHHLLHMESGANPLRLAPSPALADMQPMKSVPLVYTGGMR